MYRTYNKDIKAFLTIYLNESLKIKTDLDSVSIFKKKKNGNRNPKVTFFL